MASLYLRGNRWWLSYWVRGAQFFAPTGYTLDEKPAALKAKADLEKRLEAEAKKAAALPGRNWKTFRGYRKHWIDTRRKQGVASADDDEARLKHVPELDPLNMDEIESGHIRRAILRLRSEEKLAPRTIRHVAAGLRLLFAEAVHDKVIEVSPYNLRRGDLPKKRDASPTWRHQAIFTRDEVEVLLSHPDVPDERRVLYALLFLTGMRIGEVAALTWTAYEADLEPLGRLTVAASFNRKARTVKGTKTDTPRMVPVHPVLAKALAEWRLSGWHAYMGVKPKAESLLYPAKTGNHLRDPVVHANLLRDLAKLGLRARRTHDTRRTFISLCMADGAHKDRLRWVTHGPSEDIIDIYTTLPWEALCAQVSLLNVRSRVTVTLPLQRRTSED